MMDWDLAIKRNREALLRILVELFALVGLPEDGKPAFRLESVTLPRHLHAHAMRILRAAEAAIRRVIFIAAREMTVQLPAGGDASRPDLAFLSKAKRQQAAARGLRQASGEDLGDDAGDPATIRIPAFPLLDPLRPYLLNPPRRASKSFPRIWVLGMADPAPIPQKPVLLPDDPVDATSLCRRLLSSRRALANLPREARRLVRWKARRKLRKGPGRVSPLRFGAPPGTRKRRIHAVDDILKECHAVAFDAMSLPDTS